MTDVGISQMTLNDVEGEFRDFLSALLSTSRNLVPSLTIMNGVNVRECRVDEFVNSPQILKSLFANIMGWSFAVEFEDDVSVVVLVGRWWQPLAVEAHYTDLIHAVNSIFAFTQECWVKSTMCRKAEELSIKVSRVESQVEARKVLNDALNRFSAKVDMLETQAPDPCSFRRSLVMALDEWALESFGSDVGLHLRAIDNDVSTCFWILSRDGTWCVIDSDDSDGDKNIDTAETAISVARQKAQKLVESPLGEGYPVDRKPSYRTIPRMRSRKAYRSAHVIFEESFRDSYFELHLNLFSTASDNLELDFPAKIVSESFHIQHLLSVLRATCYRRNVDMFQRETNCDSIYRNNYYSMFSSLSDAAHRWFHALKDHTTQFTDFLSTVDLNQTLSDIGISGEHFRVLVFRVHRDVVTDMQFPDTVLPGKLREVILNLDDKIVGVLRRVRGSMAESFLNYAAGTHSDFRNRSNAVHCFVLSCTIKRNELSEMFHAVVLGTADWPCSPYCLSELELGLHALFSVVAASKFIIPIQLVNRCLSEVCALPARAAVTEALSVRAVAEHLFGGLCKSILSMLSATSIHMVACYLRTDAPCVTHEHNVFHLLKAEFIEKSYSDDSLPAEIGDAFIKLSGGEDSSEAPCVSFIAVPGKDSGRWGPPEHSCVGLCLHLDPSALESWNGFDVAVSSKESHCCQKESVIALYVLSFKGVGPRLDAGIGMYLSSMLMAALRPINALLTVQAHTRIELARLRHAAESSENESNVEAKHRAGLLMELLHIIDQCEDDDGVLGVDGEYEAPHKEFCEESDAVDDLYSLLKEVSILSKIEILFLTTATNLR